MNRFLIEREIPGAKDLTSEQLAEKPSCLSRFSTLASCVARALPSMNLVQL